MTTKRRKAKKENIPDILKQEPKNTFEYIEARIRTMNEETPDEDQKEREAEYYKRYGSREKYNGEEVGLSFLWEFIKVYKGSTIDIIPDKERGKMVKSLDNYEDMLVYSRYRDIYWHFLVKSNEHECQCAEARFWYLKLKAAIADGKQLNIDETDNFFTPKNNHEKILTIYTKYFHTLYLCRCIEVGIELIAQSLGIDDSPFRGMELFDTYIEEANKLISAHKETYLEPIAKKDINPNQEDIANAKYNTTFVKERPDAIYDVFYDLMYKPKKRS